MSPERRRAFVLPLSLNVGRVDDSVFTYIMLKHVKINHLQLKH